MKNSNRNLDQQADLLEHVSARYGAPFRVTNGQVAAQVIRFFVVPVGATRLATIKARADDLQAALHAQSLTVGLEEGGVVITVPNPNPSRVLADKLIAGNGLQPGMVVLGTTVGGKNLCANLSASTVAHILIAGTTGCGKTVLLKTIAAGLVAGAAPSQLQVLAIDPKGRHFSALSGDGHLIRPVIQDTKVAVEALHNVARVMEQRDAAHQNKPTWVIIIDELADLVMTGGAPFTDALQRLVSRGREAGIHVIAATQHPASLILTGIVKANFPLRVCGRVGDAYAAQMALGRAGSEAHLLGGRGDFLATHGAGLTRFQAAYCDDAMLRALVKPGAPQGVLVPTLVPARLCDKPAPVAPLPAREPEPETPDRVQEAVDVLRPVWTDWRERWLAQEWGIKSELCRAVWGRRAEGSFTGWIEEAAAILETATATATDENISNATSGAENNTHSTGRSRSRNRIDNLKARLNRRGDG